MHRSLLSAVLSLSVLFSTLVAAQDDSYTFTTIDVPGAVSTFPLGINAAGHIVGYFSETVDGVSQEQSFLTDGTIFTTIKVPGAAATTAVSINAAGQIVGYFREAAGRPSGFLTDGDTFTIIHIPGSLETWALGINEAGHIVGSYHHAQGETGFVRIDGVVTPFDVPGAIFTTATGINTAGHIVGTHQFGDSRVHSFCSWTGTSRRLMSLARGTRWRVGSTMRGSSSESSSMPRAFRALS